MKKKIQNPYFITIGISTLIFLFIFLIKGIYPFGENTLIYGDMYDQITAFYYHFYDIFHGDASFLVDFTTSGGMNFWGVFSYYIASPFSFLLLLFKRENLYLAVSIIVSLKAILASVTCLFSLRYFSKKHGPSILLVFLSLSYAFSGYFFSLYQITAWMDAMYLFPILMVGLKKVIDLENPCLYIGALSLSIIFSFYVSYIGLIFILLLSFFYIFLEKKKGERKMSIVSLGISTILAIGISMFITLPSFLQILSSSRIGTFSFDVFNSGVGPIQDKLSYLFPSSFLILSFFLLLKDRRRHSKFLRWYLPSMGILFLPFLIEPIHKLIHFSSYAAFPVRYGYISCYFLVLGAFYYFMNLKVEEEKNCRQLFILGITLVSVLFVIFLTVFDYQTIQKAISSLSISSIEEVFWILLLIFLVVLVNMYLILNYKKGSVKKYYLFFLGLVQIICNAYLYLGITEGQKSYLETYQVMQEFGKSQMEEGYRLKNNTSSLITNHGMVTGYSSLDHFTSLVDRKNLQFLKQLGYSSYWMKTYSKNGTLFADSILANLYYLTKQRVDSEWYQFQKISGKYRLYKLRDDLSLSFGYFTEDIDFQEADHAFSLQNKIYRAITGKKENLFTVYEDFTSRNLDVVTKENRNFYKIRDHDAVNYLEMEVSVRDKAILYLEVFNSFLNTDDQGLYEKMRIYVNHQLYKAKYPLVTNNGCLNLGEYEDEKVLIQIELLDDVSLSYMEVGMLPTALLESFIRDERVHSKVEFYRNEIDLDVASDKEGLFFIPVPYNEGYHVSVDGDDAKVISVYDHFLGVKLERGNHMIKFTYIPPGLIVGISVGIVSLVLAFFFLCYYRRIIQSVVLGCIFQFLYVGLSFLFMFFIYLVPLVYFILFY